MEVTKRKAAEVGVHLEVPKEAEHLVQGLPPQVDHQVLFQQEAKEEAPVVEEVENPTEGQWEARHLEEVVIIVMLVRKIAWDPDTPQEDHQDIPLNLIAMKDRQVMVDLHQGEVENRNATQIIHHVLPAVIIVLEEVKIEVVRQVKTGAGHKAVIVLDLWLPIEVVVQAKLEVAHRAKIEVEHQAKKEAVHQVQ